MCGRVTWHQYLSHIKLKASPTSMSELSLLTVMLQFAIWKLVTLWGLFQIVNVLCFYFYFHIECYSFLAFQRFWLRKTVFSIDHWLEWFRNANSLLSVTYERLMLTIERSIAPSNEVQKRRFVCQQSTAGHGDF